MSYLGWQGKAVRHPDGRTGTIFREEGHELCVLTIRDADGKEDRVILDCCGKDRGSPGWQWWCPEFDHGPAWLPLGENGSPLEFDPPK